jgi:hypothetical protein
MVTAIYTVIFSQIAVCFSCQRDMVPWQRTLRQKARSDSVFLSIWDLPQGKGFNPKKYPAGTGTPVSADASRQVPIQFLASHEGFPARSFSLIAALTGIFFCLIVEYIENRE